MPAWGTIFDAFAPTTPNLRQVVTRETCRAMLRCDEAQVLELEACLGTSQIDHIDLLNLGLFSGSQRSVPELVIRSLGPVLADKVRTRSPTAVWATLKASCLDACDPALATWEAPSWYGVEWECYPEPHGQFHCKGLVQGAFEPGRLLAPELRELFATIVQEFDFQFMHQDTPLSYAQLNHRGDCRVLAEVLSMRYRDAGYTSTVQHGVLLGLVSASRHSWVTVVDADARQKNVDPGLAVLTRTFWCDDPVLRSACAGSRLPFRTVCTSKEPFQVSHRCETGTRSIESVPALAHQRSHVR
jgi:hypothetical protein